MSVKRRSSVDLTGNAPKKPAPEGREERVAILDAGAQYGKIIDRRVRELSVRSDILPLSTRAEQLVAAGYRAVIISGGPKSVNDSNAPQYDPALFSVGIPLLGICYGMQMLSHHFGGTVESTSLREDGQFDISVATECPLFDGLEACQSVLLTHGDSVVSIPDCLKAVGWSGDVPAAVQHTSLPLYGLQFHPEADLTVKGLSMLRNFLYQVAGLTGNCSLESREQSCVESIKAIVGPTSRVLSLVSGGVDSTVVTALLHKALGDHRVIAVHINNGFLRHNESDKVKTLLESVGITPKIINAAQRFYNADTTVSCALEDGTVVMENTLTLNSVTSPEEKRQIIGDTFMKVADSVLSDAAVGHIFLAQGTLRPDLIESASGLASGKAHVIKTHHNDSTLVRELRDRGRVIEPLAEFHKDEVRQLGLSLGLPPEVVQRHPFPGPGLAIRIICQKEAYIREDFHTTNTILKKLLSDPGTLKLSPQERDFLEQLGRYSISATLLPIYSVGVQGDRRSYNYVAALSCDGDAPEWPHLMRLAKLIPKLVHTVNRVVWVFGGLVEGPITEVTPTFLREGPLSTVRQADHLASEILTKHDAWGCVSQMPVVLIPIHFDRGPLVPSCQRSVVLRTFITSDFMTGVPATPGVELPLPVLTELVGTLSTIPGVSRICYDLTAKPPGTTEWE